MKLGQGYIFTGVCDSVHSGGMCMARGACMARGHAWLWGCMAREVCVAGGMHGWGMHGWGVCMAGGGAW